MNITSWDNYSLYSLALSIILITVIFTKYMIHKGIFQNETGRKVLHILAILSCVMVINYTADRFFLAIVFFIFFIILLLIAHHNILLPSERKSYGIAFFSLAFGILLCTNMPLEAIVYGGLILAISDAFAGWIGSRYARENILFLSEPKSWLGFGVFFIITCIITLFFTGLTWVVIIIAIVPALSELFSFRGSDNLTVPLVAAIWFNLMSGYSITGVDIVFMLMLIPSCIYVMHKKWLTADGLGAAVLIGVVIYFSLSGLHLIPLLIFFIAGSITSKLQFKKNDASGRKAAQVLANGFIPAVCALLLAYTESENFLIAYLASIAISLSDTMSSDLGIYFKQKTYDILTGKTISVGLSGGVSIAGTLAGCISAFILALISILIFDLSLWIGGIIFIVGFTGMLTDSVIGSLWQAKYTDINNQITEDPGPKKQLTRGVYWVNNDWVNFISNALLVGLLLIFLMVDFF